MNKKCIKLTEVYSNGLLGDKREIFEIVKYINTEGYASHWGKADHDVSWPSYANSCMVLMFKKEPTFLKETPEEIAALLNE